MIYIIGEILDVESIKKENTENEEKQEWKKRMMNTFLGSRKNEKNK